MSVISAPKMIAGALGAVWLACAPAGSLAAESAARAIAVILSDETAQYREAVDGFKESLAREGSPVSYDEMTLASSEATGAALAERLSARPHDLILAIGTPAALIAKERRKDTPVVFAMVLNPVENGVVPPPGGGEDAAIAGVSLNIPLEEQFRAFRRVRPSVRRVGVLYAERSSPAFLSEARRAASAAGLELAAEPVSSARDIAAALGRVLARADSLWAGPEPLIYNASTAQRIIMMTLERRIPFMAFSRNFVKAGALVALECDYRDIGRQAGEIALAIFAASAGGAGNVVAPRRTVLIINKHTADAIGAPVDAGTMRGAVVYGK